MISYIHKLIEEGENEQLDFKFEISDPRKIAKTFSSFANTSGGRLLIGVKDNGVIAGIRSEDERFMVEMVAERYTCPIVKYELKEWTIEGKTILEVYIPQGTAKPYMAIDDENKKIAYVRVADQNFQANGLVIEYWQRKQENKDICVEFNQFQQRLLNYLASDNQINISKAVKICKTSISEIRENLIKLLLMNVIEFDISEKGIFMKLKE